MAKKPHDLPCPNCREDIHFEDIGEALGEVITCPHCESAWYVYLDVDPAGAWYSLEEPDEWD